jgi:uncharacterized coiled-coil DUF342 family protein
VSEEKTKQIANIQQQIANLKDKITKVNAETKKTADKRDELNNQTKLASQQIYELRTQRDQINEKVKALKLQRDEVRDKITPLMDEIHAINEKKQEIKKKSAPVRHEDVQKEIDAIDWKIQTETLDMTEEKRLVGEVKKLEQQIGGYKKIEKENKKITELLNQRKALQELADNFHKQLSELVKAGQEVHSKMLAKVDEAKKSRVEADLMHKAYLENREQIPQLQVEIAVLTGQFNGLRDAYRSENRAIREKENSSRAEERAKEQEKRAKEQEQVKLEKSQRAQTEQALKEKLGSQAKEKLERGEKVSWNEFQLLAGEDDEEDQDT